jgi:hypothetical protein
MAPQLPAMQRTSHRSALKSAAFGSGWHCAAFLLTLHFLSLMSAFDAELDFLEDQSNDAADDSALLEHQLVTSPLLKFPVLAQYPDAFPSRGLLGTAAGERVYINTNTPSSAVICGVQVRMPYHNKFYHLCIL